MIAASQHIDDPSPPRKRYGRALQLMASSARGASSLGGPPGNKNHLELHTLTAPEAIIDAALTIRVWQRAGLSATDISRQLDCRNNWTSVENAIVIDLLMREGKELS